MHRQTDDTFLLDYRLRPQCICVFESTTTQCHQFTVELFFNQRWYGVQMNLQVHETPLSNLD